MLKPTGRCLICGEARIIRNCIKEQSKIINAAWKAAGFKGKVQMPEASSPEVWDIGGITIEPDRVKRKSIRGDFMGDGYRVTAWVQHYSHDTGPDVSDIDLGEFRSFSDAVICAFAKLLEDKIKNAVEAEGMAMACAE